jgi:peptidylprolyl isomerase
VVQKDDYVLLTYTGKYQNGTIFDTNDVANTAVFPLTHTSPISVQVGHKQLIAGVDNALIGMRKGETKKDVIIKAKDAYGGFDPALVATLPKRLVYPLDDRVNRTIDVPMDKVPQEMRSPTALGKNFSSQNYVFTIAEISDTVVTMRLLAPHTSTIELQGYPWNSTLTKTTDDALYFHHNIVENKTYDTQAGPFVAHTNATHAILNTAFEEGKSYNTDKGVGRVSKITENTVSLDFNHPLAGYDLVFDLTVTDIIQKK